MRTPLLELNSEEIKECRVPLAGARRTIRMGGPFAYAAVVPARGRKRSIR